jgi:putative ABC transport system permease protein
MCPGLHGGVHAPGAVISHQLARLIDVEGRLPGDLRVMVRDESIPVVGVARSPFRGLVPGRPIDVWVPRADVSAHALGPHGSFRTVGRILPGVTTMQARATLGRAAQAAGIVRAGATQSVVGLQTQAFVDRIVWAPVIFFTSIAGLLLALACANVAGLLLARSHERRREMAVRGAMGAGRLRLVRQLLVESGVLSLVSVGAGLVMAAGLLKIAASHPGPAMPFVALSELSLPPSVALLALVTVVISTLGAGMLPALAASKTPLAELMAWRERPVRVRAHRLSLHELLVIGQLAVSLALLSTCGLFLSQLLRPAPADVHLGLRHLIVTTWTSPTSTSALEASHRLDSLPGVQATSPALHGPFDHLPPQNVINARNEAIPVGVNAVGLSFLDVMRQPLLRGRWLTAGDFGARNNVVVIDQALAARLQPHGEPIGSWLTLESGERCEIVGVVADPWQALPSDADSPPPLVAYIPYGAQVAALASSEYTTVLARTEGPATTVFPTLRALGAVSSEPSLQLVGFASAETARERALLNSRIPQRFGAAFLGIVGGLAAFIAMVGLLATVARAVSTRTRELAIRIAVGAAPQGAVRLVLASGLRMGCAAALVGTPLAWGAARLARSGFPGVPRLDPSLLLALAAATIAGTLVAAYLPARRAAAVDPVEVLRWE